MSFGENLREALELANLRQIDLANKTGINIKSIENYIKNDAKTIPSADKAVRIAKVLNVTVEYLVDGNNKKKDEAKNYFIRNSKITPILEKLDKYNFEVIVTIAKALLNLQKKI
ncbi:MAG: helix-turn-helix domain-containing protein [Treponema sp.]|nr:helix-turn-helix domain-containing protein [Treponema sp.]